MPNCVPVSQYNHQNPCQPLFIVSLTLFSVSQSPLYRFSHPSKHVEEALASISTLFLNACAAQDQTQPPLNLRPYEFDRKFLFRVLVLGNAQLAQIIKARGPNMQTNAACAGQTLFLHSLSNSRHTTPSELTHHITHTLSTR